MPPPRASANSTSPINANGLPTASGGYYSEGVESVDLDGTTWMRADDFYSAYLAAVGAPEWHGRNLDAVWDSLTGGDIKQRNLPYRVRIKGTSRMSADVRELVGRFQGLVQQAQRAGHSVEVELLP